MILGLIDFPPHLTRQTAMCLPPVFRKPDLPFRPQSRSRPFWLAVVMVLSTTTAWGQPGDNRAPPQDASPDVQNKEAQLVETRRAIIRDTLQLEPEIARKFWPLYDAFQTQLSELRAKRRELLTDLGQGVDGMTEAEAREYVLDKLEYEERRLNLSRAYFRKLAAFMSYKSLAVYIQVESKIRVFIEAGIEDSIPLIR